MDRVHLTIEGMSCGHCLNAVRGALEKVPGVSVERVTIGAAIVAYDPARASVDQIVDAVADQGYTAYNAA
jgi:copper chaperone